jgi:tetratricopeptide (TPR) repeat protein
MITTIFDLTNNSTMKFFITYFLTFTILSSLIAQINNTSASSSSIYFDRIVKSIERNNDKKVAEFIKLSIENSDVLFELNELGYYNRINENFIEFVIDSNQIMNFAKHLENLKNKNVPKSISNFLSELERKVRFESALEQIDKERITKDLNSGKFNMKEIIVELETRAKASEIIFDYGAAIESYEILTVNNKKLDFDSIQLADYFYKIGLNYFKKNERKEAVPYLKVAIHLTEKNLGENAQELPKMYLYLSKCIELDYEKSFALIEKAIQIKKINKDTLDAEYAFLYFRVFVYYHSLQEKNAAENALSKSMEIYASLTNPPKIDMLEVYSLAISYYDKDTTSKDFGLVQQKYYDFIPLIFPATSFRGTSMNYNIGLNYYEKKDYQNAILFLKKCNPSVINDQSFYEYLGDCFFKLKKYKQAINCFLKDERTNNNKSDEAINYTRIGEILLLDEQYDKAYVAFKKFEKLSPGILASKNWAMYYSVTNNSKKGIEYLKKSIKIGFDDYEWMQTSDSMNNLKSDPIFGDLVKLAKLNSILPEQSNSY